MIRLLRDALEEVIILLTRHSAGVEIHLCIAEMILLLCLLDELMKVVYVYLDHMLDMAVLFEPFLDCILDRVINLYDVRDYEICDYQNSEYPETDEENLW